MFNELVSISLLLPLPSITRSERKICRAHEKLFEWQEGACRKSAHKMADTQLGGSCQDELHVSSPSAGQCLVYWPEYLKEYTDYVFKIPWCHPSHKSSLCWLYHMHHESCMFGCFPSCCSLLLHDQGHFTRLDPARSSHLHQSALRRHGCKNLSAPTIREVASRLIGLEKENRHVWSDECFREEISI